MGRAPPATPSGHLSAPQAGPLGPCTSGLHDRRSMPVADRRSAAGPRRRLLAGCAVVWAASVTTVLTGTAREPVVSAVVQALVVGAPMAAALSGLAGSDRFPRLLLASGVGLAVAGLAASPSPLVYSIGRVAGWALIPGVAYVALAFPAGRLKRGLDRALAAATAVTVAVLYLLLVPLTVRYPVPTPWATCSPCPDNAFAVVDAQPQVIDAVIVPVREAV